MTVATQKMTLEEYLAYDDGSDNLYKNYSPRMGGGFV
jgi:hypothetical protein